MRVLRQIGSRQARGLSLIELLVTLGVAAILIGIAVPSFEGVFNSNRLAAASNEMIASLQAARMEAIRLNRRAGVCTSANPEDGDGAACATAGVTGWLTFVDVNGDGDFDNPGDVLIGTSMLDEAVALSSSPNVGGEVIFRPDGLARVDDTGGGSDLLDGVISFCVASTRPQENQRHVLIASGSRIAVQGVDGSGACAAPADP